MLASSAWVPRTDSPRQSRDPRLLDRQPGAPECEWSQHPVSSRATAGMPTVVQDNGVGGRSGRETQMDWNIIEGKWKELKGHAREQWGKLSDDELEEVGGKKDRLVGGVSVLLLQLADEADRRADEWAKRQDEK